MSASQQKPLPITCPQVSATRGHYSHAMSGNGLVFVSGQLPTRRDGSFADNVSFEDQVTLCIVNASAILATADLALDDVLKVTAFIVGIENWPLFDRAYADAMGSHKPARSVVPVPELHYGCKVEIEIIAMRRGLCSADAISFIGG